MAQKNLKGKGWHRDSNRHAEAAKRGWKRRDYRTMGKYAAEHPPKSELQKLRRRLSDLQGTLKRLEREGEKDSPKWRETFDETWEIFQILEAYD